MNIEKATPKIVELLNKGKKVQIEYNKKTNEIKLLEIKIHKINLTNKE